MAIFKLTATGADYQGECWVNSTAIKWMRPAAQGAQLFFGPNDCLHVAEPPKRVAALARRRQRQQGRVDHRLV